MRKKPFIYIICLTSLLALFACNNNVEDTSELWEKSMSSGDIIARSGTLMQKSSPEDRKRALDDAQNRLRTGGGMFGKKGGVNLLGGGENKSATIGVGMPINPYLWKGSLETISFMPLVSADPFAGIIITDWYNDADTPTERCKINVFIKGLEMKTQNLKVNSFCQTKINGSWVDQPINKQNNAKLENAILNKAKKIKVSQS